MCQPAPALPYTSRVIPTCNIEKKTRVFLGIVFTKMKQGIRILFLARTETGCRNDGIKLGAHRTPAHWRWCCSISRLR